MGQYTTIFKITLTLALLKSIDLTSDLFCSVEDLKNALVIDIEITRLIESSLREIQSEQAIKKCQKYLEGTYNFRQKSENVIEIVGNPIHAFLIIKRLVIDLREIQDALNNPSVTDRMLRNDLDDILKPISVTRFGDLKGAVNGIARLQQTYHMLAKDLARGIILGQQTTAKMTADDALQFALIAMEENNLHTAAEWVDEALALAKNEQQRNIISSFATSVRVKHDEILGDELSGINLDGLTYSTLYNKLSHTAAHDQIKSYINSKREDDFTRKYWEHNGQEYQAELCRGKRFLTSEEESKLFCTYVIPHPFFTIQPIKTEVQSIDPLLLTFYNILSPAEAEIMKSIGKNRQMERSGVGTGNEKTQSRISKTIWIDDEDELVQKISKRISLITKLSTTYGDAERFQIVNYGIGGSYDYHFDFYFYEEENGEIIKIEDLTYGNRLATFLIYLSDVQQGGATAFLSAGVAVKPVLGAATFWYNLNTDGTGNKDTTHAGCPVVLGTKWIANKWFLENGQMFRTSCIEKNKPHTFNNYVLN